MMRATIASRSIALEMAARTRVSRNGFLPPGAATPGAGVVEIVEMQIDHAVRQRLHHLEARVGLDARQILDRDVLDQVDVAGEQRGDARAGAGDRAEDDALPGRLLAPIGLVALQDDAVALGVAHEPVGAGADRGLAGIERLGLRVGADTLAFLPVERDRAGAVLPWRTGSRWSRARSASSGYGSSVVITTVSGSGAVMPVIARTLDAERRRRVLDPRRAAIPNRSRRWR